MFSRRKSRSVHKTAYTGVNHVAPAANQPDSAALAAALTIGHGSMQNGKPQQQQQPTIKRSNSMQYIIKKVPAPGPSPGPSPQRTSGSLLRRSPSLTNSPSIHHQHKNQPPQFHNFSGGSLNSNSSRGSHASKVVYDIDDSFNDSYLDEITEETSQTYLNNHNDMKDLRLSHIAPSKTIKNSYSRASLSSKQQQPVKMVKKYIPTPNGIKIVEVPESNLAQEISRNNSIRSVGRGAKPANKKPTAVKRTSRTSSLNSFSSPSITHRKPSSRLSSLGSSTMTPMVEVADLEESLGYSDELKEHELKMQALQKQIDHEKVLAKELELKKLEYEKLKLLRLNHEVELSDYTSRVSEQTLSPSEDETPVHMSSPIRKPALTDIQDKEDGEAALVSETIPDASIDASNVMVDEYDKKKFENSQQVVSEELDSSDYDTDRRELKSLDQHGSSNTELGIINQYGNFHTNELLNRDSIIEHPVSTDEEDTDHHSGGLANHLRPKFDAVPEIIEEPVKENDSSLQLPPVVVNGGSSRSSLRSVSSYESSINSQKARRPVKSAMKNSNSFYNGNSATEKLNAAHQAYLSLTTAENTRLNSKLSSAQLNEARAENGIQAAPAPAPTTKTVQKRMSQTLRKAPQQAQAGGMAGRSLRPQSVAAEPTSTRVQHEAPKSNGGMSGRSLRNSTYTQPIAPHPALQPGYQSPSKLKAAELYAKANSRPLSTFAAPTKKSSFTKDDENARSKHRTTLRDPAPVPVPITHQPSTKPHTQSHNPQPTHPISHKKTISTSSEASPSHGHGFRSRFDDSDDEQSHANISHSGGFSSRFRDSDEEVNVPKNIPPLSSVTVEKISHGGHSSAPAPITTLREKKTTQEPPKKEKKKFGKLRKLFGGKSDK